MWSTLDSFIQTISDQVFIFPGNEIYLAALLQHVAISQREYLIGNKLRLVWFDFLFSRCECQSVSSPLLWFFLSVMGNYLNDSNFYCTVTEHHAWNTRSKGR